MFLEVRRSSSDGGDLERAGEACSCVLGLGRPSQMADFMHHPSELQTFVSGEGSVFIHILERSLLSEWLIIFQLLSLFTAAGGLLGPWDLTQR